MAVRARAAALVALLLVAACECQDGDAPVKRAQPAAAPAMAHEGPPPELPPPEGSPASTEQLIPFAPDAIAGFAHEGPADPRTSELPNGGRIPAIRRVYKRDYQTLQLEISDTQHAPVVRALIQKQQGQERKSSRNTFRGATIAGQPALVQWHADPETAIVNVLVADRFLVNVKVSPADSADAALVVAEALPFAELSKLAASVDPSPDEPGVEADVEGQAPEEAPRREVPARAAAPKAEGSVDSKASAPAQKAVTGP